MGLEAAAGPGGQFVEDHLSDVVAVVAVLGSRVAKAYDQPGVGHGSVLLRSRSAAGRGDGGGRAGAETTAAGPRKGPGRRRIRRNYSAAGASACFFGGLGDVDDEGLGVGQEDGALGQDQVRSVDVLAGGTAFDADLDGGRQVGCLGLEGDDRQFLVEDVAGGKFAGEVDGDVNGDLLARADGQEVEVLDDLLDRIALDVLDQGEVLFAVDVQGQQGVGDADGQGGGLGRQR